MGSCLSGDGASTASSPSSSSSSITASIKRRLRRNSSKLENWLHKIPGRAFMNGSTDNASLCTKQGKKGINQDAMIVWENFGSKEDTIFCGVFDGHGPNGHLVARKVRDSLPLKLCAQWQLISASTNGTPITDTSSSGMTSDRTSLDYDKYETDFFPTLKETFLKAFKVMDKELKTHPTLDCFCSGTTAVTLIKQGQELVIGNIGDSRAVLGTREKHNILVPVQLTVDLKPNLPREAERIRLYKGRVFALKNEPTVPRIWLPNSNSPGLAMARAFGDFCLKGFGLISVPEVSYYRLTEKDEFVVLATDGVWDVLSNKEVVDIVASAPQSSAARTLVESALRSWRYKFPTSKVDDCAVVCLFLKSSADSPCTSFSSAKDQVVMS